MGKGRKSNAKTSDSCLCFCLQGLRSCYYCRLLDCIFSIRINLVIHLSTSKYKIKPLYSYPVYLNTVKQQITTSDAFHYCSELPQAGLARQILPYHFLKLVSFLRANPTKSTSIGPRLLRGTI